MFNLVFSLDKDSEKLIIEPEIDYYQLNANTLLDITDLVDYDSEISIEPASGSIDYNKISAKYNISDKDFHNSYCLSQYGRAFGEFKTEFESYAKGELAIKNEFTICKSATYIYNDYYTFTASYENENGNLKKVSADKAFVGVRKVHTDTHSETIKLWYNENIYENYNSAQYNILDFCSSNFDYCYDTPRVVFSSMDNLPIDNLFYTYYFKVLQEYIQLSGKIVRLKCYFDPITFSTLSKKRVVYWENNYWKLLKVSDWSPTKPVVDVTLLKMIDVEVPKIEKKPVIVSGNWQFGGWLKPLMVDTDNVSVDFLETLGRQGVMISNKAELVNVSDVNEINEILFKRYIQDNISKYDQVEHKIVECLLDNWTEMEFPDYSYFKGIYLFPVEYIEDFIFQNIIFTGNIIDVQDDLLKKLVKIQSYLKRKFFATNFNITAISDEAYSEKITGWVMECLIKLDTSEATCIDMRERYLVDGISKYDRQTYTIIECLLPSGSEAVFPNYTYFLDDYQNPVDKITLNIFKNIKFIGDFKMNNLENIENYDFYESIFEGIFEGINIKNIGEYAFENSHFTGSFKLQKCEYIGAHAFYLSKFNGVFNCPNLQAVGNGAFWNSVFSGSLSLPVCVKIGDIAFTYSNFSGSLDLPLCTAIGFNAFRNSNLSGSLNLPLCTAIGYRAFLNSNFTTITIGANATLESNCIGAHSTEFIQDYADNGKLAGTYVWDGQHWIYQN